MILVDYFDLASASEKSVLTILKATQAGINNLSELLLTNGAKFLSKLISDLCSLSVTSKSIPDICRVAKLKPL